MKSILISILFCYPIFFAGAQNKVADAEAALSNSDYATAYQLANEALSDKSQPAKAYYIRGKAGIKISDEALHNDDAAEEKKYIHIPLQSYGDFKNAMKTGDAALNELVRAEYTKLANVLLLAGTKYDSRFKESPENADSSLIDRSIENFSAAIEMYSATKNEKFKPYLFRGDAYFTKKKFNEALADYTKAMTLFENTTRGIPDFNIGDLGYRLAYMQAAIFNKKDVAFQTIAKTRKLLAGEMALADSTKAKLGERYAECKTEYEFFLGELAELEGTLKK